jgi:Fe-S-cluster containining protein
MCCDGTLFQRVLLRTEELEPARRRGLKIVEDRGFEQPCSALVEHRCSVYDERPEACRAFVCRLLERVRTGSISESKAVRAIARTRELLAILERAGCTRTESGEVHFSAEGDDAPVVMAAFSELMERLEEHFRRADAPVLRTLAKP